MNYNEYKAPKRNRKWKTLIWGLLILNILTFIWNIFTGTWGIWFALAGIIFSIYNLYMHYTKGIDPWN
jgi:hypothetical protein